MRSIDLIILAIDWRNQLTMYLLSSSWASDSVLLELVENRGYMTHFSIDIAALPLHSSKPLLAA